MLTMRVVESVMCADGIMLTSISKLCSSRYFRYRIKPSSMKKKLCSISSMLLDKEMRKFFFIDNFNLYRSDVLLDKERRSYRNKGASRREKRGVLLDIEKKKSSIVHAWRKFIKRAWSRYRPSSKF